MTICVPTGSCRALTLELPWMVVIATAFTAALCLGLAGVDSVTAAVCVVTVALCGGATSRWAALNVVAPPQSPEQESEATYQFNDLRRRVIGKD